jgi:ABC-type oligopeptide transport system substrate-binding subunit
MKFIMVAAATCLVLAGCAQPSGPPVVRESSGPALNPTGSNGPMSGQPENTNSAAGSTIVRGPALNPTGSVGAASGQPSNMNTSAGGGYMTAPPRNPTGSVGYQQ